MNDAPAQERAFRWMWPARHLDWLRPGFRAATEADETRLQHLPSAVALLLPLAAIAMPLAFSIGTATSPQSVQGDPYDLFAFLIYDVFTESVPFMLAALAIGVASPAAGILVVLSYAVGNLAATVVTGELEPPLFATVGRLASFALLWLLVVEIPLLARLAVESFGARADAGMARRLVAVVGGAIVVTGLTWIWALIAPISIQAVFWLTSLWGSPFLRPVWTLLYSPHVVIIPAGFIAAAVLAARYLGKASTADADDVAQVGQAPARGWLPYASALTLTGLLLLGVLEKPVDAVILFVAIVTVPPLARIVVRTTRTASLLTRIPWPVRLIIGVGLSYPVSLAFLSAVGYSDVSRWFNTLFALVMSFFIIELLLEADAAAAATAVPDRAGSAPVANVVAGLFALMTLLSLAMPVVVLAHGGSGESDGDAALGASAAAGGAAAAAAARRRQGQRPPPHVPDRFKPRPGRKPPKWEDKHKPPKDKSLWERTTDAFKDTWNSAKDFFNR